MRIVWGLLAFALIGFLAWLIIAPGTDKVAQRQPPPVPVVPVNPPAASVDNAPLDQQPAKRQMLAREKAEAERLAALAAQDEAAKARTETKLYYRVVVQDGGTLEAGDVVIRLAGIKARETEAQCEDENGRTWPCGAAARTALARLIRSRAVACTVPSGGEQPTFVARCSVGDTDLSFWMVRQGWAEASEPAAPDLAQAIKQARRERVGFWRAPE